MGRIANELSSVLLPTCNIHCYKSAVQYSYCRKAGSKAWLPGILLGLGTGNNNGGMNEL